MDAQRFRDIESAFQRALELTPGNRDAFLKDLAQRDAELSARVAAMLAADDEADDPMQAAIRQEGQQSEVPLPQQIGAFQVLRKLGEGGMGVVYLCKRQTEDFEQLLAVKRLNASVDSELAHHRLKVERRVLASLKHVHIAQFVDGGEDKDGTPFVAMEFVDGQPIDAYVRDRALSRDERVQLFLALCDAVQFAHGNLIIHRDIKAANVLIEFDGQLKLLDFGIAKLIGDEQEAHHETVMTVAGAMTPHYASPEQVRGETVTPLTDVYSMGVLLYELLAGRRPYDIQTRRPTEIEKIICLTEPPPPLSTARGREGDLNSIVAKAMHKDPARRYPTAAQFADDLRRWLDGRAVEARPDSAAYRLSVFARRHPFGLASAGLFSVVLIGFSAAMAWQAHQLSLERDRATREANVATETADFLIDLFGVSDPRVTNPADVRARDLLEQAAEELPDALDSDPLMRAQLMHVIGLAFANLGEDARGTELLSQALVLREEHAGPDSAELADSRNRLGNVHRRYGRLQEAEPLLVQALEWRRAQGVIDDDLADSYNNVGLLQNDLGWYDRAEASLRQSIALHRQVTGADTTRVASPLHNLSLSLRRQGDYEAARAAAQESVAIKKSTEWSQTSLAVTLAVLANIERELDLLDSAFANSEESLELRRSVYGDDNVLLASGLVTHGRILADLNQQAEGLALMRRAIELHEAAGSLNQYRAAAPQRSLALLLLEMGQKEEANYWGLRALEIAQRELPAESPELERFVWAD
ncbi:MAG: serine/threonine-protein kinase [Pseudomonadota bacterium]